MFCFLFFYIGDRFGRIDHNGASRVSKFTEKQKQKQTNNNYAFVHSRTANGLDGAFWHAALLFVAYFLVMAIGIILRMDNIIVTIASKAKIILIWD